MTVKKFENNPHLEGTRDEYLESHIKMVYKVAQSFYARGEEFGLDTDDVDQIGMIGYIKAYDNYDPTNAKLKGRVTKFTTYAYPKIKGEILRYFANVGQGGMKVSRTVIDLALKLRYSERTYSTASDVMEDYDVSEWMACDALEIVHHGKYTISAESPITTGLSGDEELRIMDVMEGDLNVHSIVLNEFLSTLTYNQRRIVELRFIHFYTQAEVGEILGITQAHVSRVEKAVREITATWLEFGYTATYLKPETYLFDKMQRERIEKREAEKQAKLAKPKPVRKGRPIRGDIELARELMMNSDLSPREIHLQTRVSYHIVLKLDKELRTKAKRKKVKTRVAKERYEKLHSEVAASREA